MEERKKTAIHVPMKIWKTFIVMAKIKYPVDTQNNAFTESMLLFIQENSDILEEITNHAKEIKDAEVSDLVSNVDQEE
ncbi:MAG: hypothetical protein ACXVHW_00680 [Methanobacterium sp.]